MNALLSPPRRLLRPSDGGSSRIGLLLSVTGVLAVLVAMLGIVPATAGGGTVKIDGDDLAGGGNVPHRVCEINVEWDSFPAGDYSSTVFFDEQGGGGGTPVATNPPSGNNSPSVSEPFTISAATPTHNVKYAIDPTGLTLTKQGYHLKVSVDVTPVGGASTYSKFKVLYALACDVSFLVDKTNNADGTGYAASETATSAGADVPFKATITNTSSDDIDVDSVTDSVGGAVLCSPALTTIASGASADCLWTMTGYSPPDGVSKTNTVSVTAHKHGVVAVAATNVSNVSTVTTHVPGAPPPPPPGPGPATVPTQVAAAAPTATQSVCSNGSATTPSYTVPTTTGVVYSPATGGPAVAGTTVTVTAAAAAGYALTGPSSFSLVFAAAPNCTVPPPDEDLGLSKTGPGTAKPGDVITYTIDVTNIKGTPATGFLVSDTLPTGLTPQTVDGTGFGCTVTGQAVACTYNGSLAVGDTATITVTALLAADYSAGTVFNTAVVDPGRADSDPANDTSTATTVVVAPEAFTGGGGGGAVTPPTEGGGAALPFTGSNTDQLLQAGVGMFVLGLFLSLATRRRRVPVESPLE